MLQLKGITKDYTAGDTVVHALKGVDLSFRRSEFVSVLGPSGCGKTTLLNIIGGLDHYTGGEMFIDGISTVNYSGRDWDTYRNHRIGFVFQSYNLIPHQTIQENVELALSISGVGKDERRRRAREALDKVGLEGQYNKKPNQLSGGQCQRVAIARALVNEPEILLADEPTGALDTGTSTQIMELIKEIADNCLVIMVTHNPELAQQYSTRIIRLLDGEVQSDTDPFDGQEETARDEAPSAAEETQQETIAAQTLKTETGEDSAQEQKTEAEENAAQEQKKKKDVSKKAKLSFWSAFKLSARNLRSKFKRSFLVCLAGSIGIIGVALVLAVSAGVQGYIRDMQNDMLSGNPVTVSESAFDLSGMLNTKVEKAKAARDALKATKHKDGTVDIKLMIEFLVDRSKDLESISVHNDITPEYVTFVEGLPKEHYAAIVKYYGIDLSNNLYTDFTFEGKEAKTRMSLSSALSTYTALLDLAAALDADVQTPEGEEKKIDYKQFAQYIPMMSDSFAMAPDNAKFILDQYDIVSDPEKSKIATEADEIMIVLDGDDMIADLTLAQYGYLTQEQFFNIVYKAIGDHNFKEDTWKEYMTYDEMLGKTFTWYPNDAVYTKLGEDFIQNPEKPEQQMANPVPFAYKAEESKLSAADKAKGKDLKVTAILRPKKGTKYGCLESGFYYTAALAQEILDDSATSAIVRFMNNTDQSGIASGIVNGNPFGIMYDVRCALKNSAGDLIGNTDPDVVDKCMQRGFVGTKDTSSLLASMIGMGGSGGTKLEMYALSLREVGGNTNPSSIAIYPVNFKHKNNVTKYLDQWNADKPLTIGGVEIPKDQRDKITYTDNLSVIIGLINSLIQMITIALVAFTSLSLVVSTVMVAIITYVSVMERIKEIGVIRSLGGRKRDVSNLFNAETFIIGGLAGVIGIAITYILSFIINIIVKQVAGIATIAALSPVTAIIMIVLSIGLTLISGLVPARAAAKKDPVEALRTE